MICPAKLSLAAAIFAFSVAGLCGSTAVWDLYTGEYAWAALQFALAAMNGYLGMLNVGHYRHLKDKP